MIPLGVLQHLGSPSGPAPCSPTHFNDAFWFPPHGGYAWADGRWQALLSTSEIRTTGTWATSEYRPTTLTLQIVLSQVPPESFPLDCRITLHTNQHKALGHLTKTLTSPEEIVGYLIPLDWSEIPAEEFIHQLGCSAGEHSAGKGADILCIEFTEGSSPTDI